MSAHESLCARTGVDAGRLDTDEPPRAALRRCGDADQRHHLLRGELRYRRAPLERITSLDVHLGAPRALAIDDVPRNVLRELLDEERLADHDLIDRLLEQLGK